MEQDFSSCYAAEPGVSAEAFFFFCIAMRCLHTLKHKVCLQEYQTLLMFQTN